MSVLGVGVGVVGVGGDCVDAGGVGGVVGGVGDGNGGVGVLGVGSIRSVGVGVTVVGDGVRSGYVQFLLEPPSAHVSHPPMVSLSGSCVQSGVMLSFVVHLYRCVVVVIVVVVVVVGGGGGSGGGGVGAGVGVGVGVDFGVGVVDVGPCSGVGVR